MEVPWNFSVIRQRLLNVPRLLIQRSRGCKSRISSHTVLIQLVMSLNHPSGTFFKHCPASFFHFLTVLTCTTHNLTSKKLWRVNNSTYKALKELPFLTIQLSLHLCQFIRAHILFIMNIIVYSILTCIWYKFKIFSKHIQINKKYFFTS